jgi:hypothetical protein
LGANGLFRECGFDTCLAVILAKICDRLEVRHQSTGEPDQFNVPLRLTLQTPAGLDAVQVAVEVDLQERAGMVPRTPGDFGLHAFKAQLLQIEFIDEHVNDPHWVILSNVVVEMFRKQRTLRTIFAFDKSLHSSLPLLRRGEL